MFRCLHDGLPGHPIAETVRHDRNRAILITASNTVGKTIDAAFRIAKDAAIRKVRNTSDVLLQDTLQWPECHSRLKQSRHEDDLANPILHVGHKPRGGVSQSRAQYTTAIIA